FTRTAVRTACDSSCCRNRAVRPGPGWSLQYLESQARVQSWDHYPGAVGFSHLASARAAAAVAFCRIVVGTLADSGRTRATLGRRVDHHANTGALRIPAGALRPGPDSGRPGCIPPFVDAAPHTHLRVAAAFVFRQCAVAATAVVVLPARGPGHPRRGYQ